jgi:hypothetical protein
MKMTLVAALLLPLFSARASAQVRFNPISPRINPIAGLPRSLPSPLTGPLGGRGVTLPSPVLTPGMSLPAPMALPAALPALVAPAASRAAFSVPAAVGAAMSAPVALPAAAALFAAADSKKASATAAAPAAPADLRNLFDGSRKPADIAWEPILPRDRQPTPGRRHSLPEDDLERELGVSF